MLNDTVIKMCYVLKQKPGTEDEEECFHSTHCAFTAFNFLQSVQLQQTTKLCYPPSGHFQTVSQDSILYTRQSACLSQKIISMQESLGSAELLNDVLTVRQNCSAYTWKQQLEVSAACRACVWLLAHTETTKACWSHWHRSMDAPFLSFLCTKAFSLPFRFLPLK